MTLNLSNVKEFLFCFLGKQKWKVFGMVVSILLISIFTVVDPYLLKLLIDQIDITDHKKIDLKNKFFLLIILSFLIFGLLNNLVWRTINYLSLRTFPFLRLEIFSKVFSYISLYNYNFFSKNLTGDLASKIQNLTDCVEEIFTPSLNIIYILFTALITIGVTFTINAYFSVILLIWVILFISISFKISNKVKSYSRDLAQEKGILNGQHIDSLTNIFNINVFARQEFEKNRLNVFSYKVMEKDIKLRFYMMKLWFVQAMLCTLVISTMIVILIYFFSKNLITKGDLVFVIYSTSNITYHIFIIAELISKVIEKIGVCSQALDILHVPNYLVNDSNKKVCIDSGLIEFKNVSFSYHTNNKIFKYLNLIIYPKQKIGIVGYSGTGKTTLINLILRLYDVQSGCIKIDNQDIKDVSLFSLRESIALIPQNPLLFNRTIMDNIRYGRINADDNEVFDASKKAHLHHIIKSLENGYDTLVGENGTKLSGGQRQRVAIARAILKNSLILILDEATSSLDSVTEEHIQDSFKKLMKNKTVIVIAHRVSTLSQMDRIIVLNEGKIEEDGAHEELIKRGGLYANIFRAQKDGFLPSKKTDRR